MAIKLFELGFVIKAVDQYSRVMKGVETRLEGLNASIAKTAKIREAGVACSQWGPVSPVSAPRSRCR